MKTTANFMVVADTETGGLPCKASKGKPEKKAFSMFHCVRLRWLLLI